MADIVGFLASGSKPAARLRGAWRRSTTTGDEARHEINLLPVSEGCLIGRTGEEVPSGEAERRSLLDLPFRGGVALAWRQSSKGMNCPSCQTENEPSAASCFKCGRAFYALTEGSVLAGRYEILSPLGQGGMGMVYRAKDRELDEVVAVKVLRPDLASSPEMAQRFRSEIRLARKVRHRNVCGIHEYGQEGHLRFISMELVDGVDLKRVIQASGPLPPYEAYEVGIAVAEGLGAIHEAGIIHRDLKTANIMRDSRGVVRLMDFGIAKEWRAVSTPGTTAGQVIGTPEYMSPEQARGGKADFRSDIYGLGVVLFELFTGEVPFHGDTPVVTMMKQLQEAAPLEGRLAARLPPTLVPVLRKALAKTPTERYQTARELADALQRARDTSPTENWPLHPPAPLRVPTPAESSETTPYPAPFLSPDRATADKGPVPVGSPLLVRRLMPSLLAVGGAGLLLTLFVGIRAMLPPAPSPALSAAAAPRLPATAMTTTAPPASVSPEAKPLAPTVAEAPGGRRAQSPGRAAALPFAAQKKTPLEPQPMATLAAIPSPTTPLDASALERVCASGDAQGCFNLGEMYALGQGVPKDETRAVTLFDRACSAGNYPACFDLGVMYTGGWGVAKDAARAVPPYKQACDGGVPWACFNLGVMYAGGQGVERDTERAVPLYRQACDGGVSQACWNLGFIYFLGEGVPKDESTAAVLMKRACDGGVMAGCNGLGVMHRDGLAGPKSDASAVILFQRACDGKEMWGCYNLGAMYESGRGVAKEEARASALYQQACDGGNSSACSDLGVMYESGHGVPQDFARATALYKNACDAAVGLACRYLGVMYADGRGTTKDSVRAVALFQRACDGGDPGGCGALAYMYDKGNGGAMDVTRAGPLYKTACDAGFAVACLGLGDMYYSGRGFAKDEAFARSFFAKACAAGATDACERLRGLAPFSGNYIGTAQDNTAGAGVFNATLVQTGTSLSGTWRITFPAAGQDNAGQLSGTASATSLSATLTPSDKTSCPFNLTASLSGKTLAGTYASVSPCPAAVTGTFQAVRQ